MNILVVLGGIGVEGISNIALSYLEEFEKSDDNGVEYPRFKVHDDSSCVYLDIYK